jgi:hypothetical protein
MNLTRLKSKGKVKSRRGQSHFEVRWTKYVAGQLIIHEYDRPTDIAILVTGQSPHYFIAGWIPIAMAQKPRYRHSKQPNWWVTQINLQPIENLRKSNYGQSQFECRKCKKVTIQLIHKVTDNLPDGVEVIQCTKCEVMGVAQIGTSNANL